MKISEWNAVLLGIAFLAMNRSSHCVCYPQLVVMNSSVSKLLRNSDVGLRVLQKKLRRRTERRYVAPQY
ncbi:unnamed protein product [Cylicocyclus nassatus]|uniref:Secreted protein n=1 Tax=Cylicocyclus nassatus TaxID=53992 RepID=A0AA36MB55_CYLNA|nr:unnamed protein product [Cylicocyclus nassatus]